MRLKMNGRPTIRDVAERANVSITTVSRVLNGTAVVAEETAQRVQAAIDELSYIPRTAARVLASRRTHTLGLLLPVISGPFFSTILRGIEATTREHDYDLLIHTTHYRRENNRPPRRPLGEHNTDGLLVFTDSLSEDELAELAGRNFPVVLLHQSPPQGLEIPCISVENKAGSRKLVDHLIEVHGYRHIAFLTGPEGNEDSYWREMGYREALEEHGLPFDPALVAMGGFSESGAQEPIERWLNDGRSLDAIFAGDDQTAVGAIRTLRAAGVQVPEEVAVVGFDDIPTSRYLTPSLTTVRAATERVGREAVRQLVRLIGQKEADPLVLLPTELVIRRSCGCNS